MKHFIYSNFSERRKKYREISHFAEDFIASDTSRNEIKPLEHSKLASSYHIT